MMYALVDNKYNRVWAFFETSEEALNNLQEQEDPTFYRVEEVERSDYFNEDGRLITQKFQG